MNQIEDLLSLHPMGKDDPYRYSQGEIKHIRDAILDQSRVSTGTKKLKLEILALGINSVLESMQISDQQFVYFKGKLN